MLKYTSFYAVKGQYTQQGCKQDRFCTIQPFAHCTLTSNSDTVPLILSHILSFLELKGHLEKNILSHAISALFRQCVFISGQQILLCCSMPSCLSGILTMRPMRCLDTLATGVLDSRRQNYHFKDLQCPHLRLKWIDGVNPPCVNQKTDICVPLGNFVIYSLFFSFLFILLPLQLCISTSSTSSLVRFRNWKLLGYIWNKTGPPCSIKCYTVKIIPLNLNVTRVLLQSYIWE